MTSKIKILPENITNKIAAGEVVQRPESVVKELIENSVDANAKSIELIIKNAGKSLIQVVDDGDGMTEEDAVLCVQKHATSKINDYADLEKIATYGFRGEALSSIAAVSQFEIRTRTDSDELGVTVKLEDFSTIKKEKDSMPKGTTVIVKNLFYNTPARRNFLKSSATELKHIIETFKRAALSHPEIAFRFYNDDDLIFNFESGTAEDRIRSVFADNIFDVVIPVEELTEFISVRGYIAKPNFLRKSRGEQYLFINKRPVANKIINHAVFSGYENLLDKGDYPFFILYFELDPARVDVNVHPSKLEVKFEDEKDIYSFVNAVVRKSLGTIDLVPSVTFSGDDGEKEKLRFNGHQFKDTNDFSDRPGPRQLEGETRKKSVFSEDEIDALFDTLNVEIKSSAPPFEVLHPFADPPDEDKPADRSVAHEDKDATGSSFIVLLHSKYILAQIKSGLMIIDQHAAHERILYEKVLKSFNANMPVAQQLIFPQSITLDPGDYALLNEIAPFLNKIGFELKFSAKNKVTVNGAPEDIKVGAEAETLVEILNEYKQNMMTENIEIRDNLAKSYSCKAAIKTGDRPGEREMRILVDQLFATSTPYVCPHGRPIIIKIPLTELDKRFGRT